MYLRVSGTFADARGRESSGNLVTVGGGLLPVPMLQTGQEPVYVPPCIQQAHMCMHTASACLAFIRSACTVLGTRHVAGNRQGLPSGSLCAQEYQSKHKNLVPP